MPSMRSTVISATALVALVQYCPAPFIAAIPAAAAAGWSTVAAVVGTAATVAGTVTTAVQSSKNSRSVKMDVRGLSRVVALAARQDPNERAWQLCHDQVASASITFSSENAGEVLVAGMPPACMTLSGVLTDQYNEGNPVPQGVDSILFTGLSDEDIQEIQDALNQKQGS